MSDPKGETPPNCNGLGGAGISKCKYCKGNKKVTKKKYKIFMEEQLKIDNAYIKSLYLLYTITRRF